MPGILGGCSDLRSSHPMNGMGTFGSHPNIILYYSKYYIGSDPSDPRIGDENLERKQTSNKFDCLF